MKMLPKIVAWMWLRSVFDSYTREAELAPSTVKRWSPVVDRLIAHLGHDDAAAIARADIVAWNDALLDGGMSNVTVRDVYVAAVKSMRQFAVDQGQLTQNPAKEVKVRVRKALEERDKAFDGREAGTILSATLRKPSDRPAPRWRQRGDGCLDLRLSTSSKAHQDGIQGFSWA
jgi:site-specific recombinase XerC